MIRNASLLSEMRTIPDPLSITVTFAKVPSVISVSQSDTSIDRSITLARLYGTVTYEMSARKCSQFDKDALFVSESIRPNLLLTRSVTGRRLLPSRENPEIKSPREH